MGSAISQGTSIYSPRSRTSTNSSQMFTSVGIQTDPNTSPQSTQINNSEELLCKICQCGSSVEELISPCKCRGSLGMVHQSCIEMWLSQSNSTSCEICETPFDVTRTPKSFREWLKKPAKRLDRQNLIADCACFAVLLPLSFVSTWLCVVGAMHYMALGVRGEYEALGLMVITTFLILIFLGWVCVTLRYHYSVWREWRNTHYNVRILCNKCNETDTNKTNPVLGRSSSNVTANEAATASQMHLHPGETVVTNNSQPPKSFCIERQTLTEPSSRSDHSSHNERELPPLRFLETSV